MTLMTPLPRKARTRLWLAHRRDALGCVLCDCGHWRAAQYWWQLTGGW